MITAVANRVPDWIEPARAGARGALLVALLAVLLAGVGVYGVSAYAVRQPFRKIGLRPALGARLVVDFATASMRPVVIGSCIGVLLSVAASSLGQGLQFGPDAPDATTCPAAVGLFFLVAGIRLG